LPLPDPALSHTALALPAKRAKPQPDAPS